MTRRATFRDGIAAERMLAADRRAPSIGVPYHRAVRGPDGRYWWAECPTCGAVVLNKDGHGAGRHWTANHQCRAVVVTDTRSIKCNQTATYVMVPANMPNHRCPVCADHRAAMAADGWLDA